MTHSRTCLTCGKDFVAYYSPQTVCGECTKARLDTLLGFECCDGLGDHKKWCRFAQHDESEYYD